MKCARNDGWEGCWVALSASYALTEIRRVSALGAWAGIFGLLVAIAMLFGDQEFLLWFLVRIKAKYMVAIYHP